MTASRKAQLIKTISLSGAVGAVFYFLHIIFGRIFYEGYDPFAQAVSDLTAANSPSRNIAQTFAFIYGIFTVTFSTAFSVYFKGKLNKAVTAASFFFCIMTVISFFGYTFFPLSEAGYAGTLQDKIHAAVTVLVVVFTVTALILFIIGFLKIKEHKYLGVISLCALALLITGAMLLNTVPTAYFGLAERINVYSVVIYTAVLSIWAYRYITRTQ